MLCRYFNNAMHFFLQITYNTANTEIASFTTNRRVLFWYFPVKYFRVLRSFVCVPSRDFERQSFQKFRSVLQKVVGFQSARCPWTSTLGPHFREDRCRSCGTAHWRRFELWVPLRAHVLREPLTML